MTIPQAPIEVELFARGLDVILTEAERDVILAVQPTIDRLMEQVIAESEGGITDARLDQLTAPLNRQLQNLLGGAMFTLQDPLRNHAATAGPIKPQATLFGPGTLLKRAEMDGTAIATWFKKASASRWQTGLMDLIRRGLQDGIQEAATTVREGITRLTNTVVETALWSMAGQHLELTWQEPERWIYSAVLDPLTCPQCAPWANKTAKKLSQLPETPQHPRCRCSRYPLFEDEVA